LRTGLKQLHQTASAIDVENRRVILDLLEPSGAASVIDMGCGDGSFTVKIGERIGTAAISGIEVDEESVRLGEQKQLKIIRADLNQALPLESASLDVVVSNQVIEHLWLTDLFLKEIHRVLKPGGYAVISTPNLATWQNIAAIIWGYQLFATGICDEVSLGNPWSPLYRQPTRGGAPASHHRVFTYRGLKELLEHHRFKIEKIVGVGYFPLPTRAARLISRLDPRHAMYLTVKVSKT
jgi:methionine biosynthesis protein MetW